MKLITSSNVKTNHTIFFSFKQHSTPQPILNMKGKYACRNVKNDAEKLIRKVTLKMIEKENSFFLKAQKFENVYL